MTLSKRYAHNEQWDALHAVMACGVVVLNGAGAVVSANEAALRIMDRDRDDVRGRMLESCMPEATREDGSALCPEEHPGMAALHTGCPQPTTIMSVARPNGERRWLQVDAVPLPNDGRPESPRGQGRRVVVSFTDITESRQMAQALQHQALHDALTNLPNRTLLIDRLQQALRSALRPHHRGGDPSPLALLLLDLDRFKEINDTLGHHVGDVLLQQVGTRLSTVLRASDTVARLGGDEFALVLPGADVTGATWVSQKILSLLAEPFTIEGHSLEIRASIGLALCPSHGTDAASLLRQADVAMYVAKGTGSGFALYDSAQDRHSANRLTLMGDLREAIAHDGLVLYYQPKIDVASGQIHGVEALLRWPHPQHGILTPDHFIPLAEETGLIAPLSRWVLDTALHQCRVWRRSGLDLGVAVNLSMSTLHDPQLPQTVAWLLRRYGVNPEALTLEITESAIMADAARTLDVVTRLSKLGVHIAIDDFGTGYSSLEYLKRLPVDELKIDKSFVVNMVGDDDDASIVSFTIGLGHSLGMRIVAEGVERPETRDLLAALGCDTAQGFLLSRPLTLSELDQWLDACSPDAERASG